MINRYRHELMKSMSLSNTPTFTQIKFIFTQYGNITETKYILDKVTVGMAKSIMPKKIRIRMT